MKCEIHKGPFYIYWSHFCQTRKGVAGSFAVRPTDVNDGPVPPDHHGNLTSAIFDFDHTERPSIFSPRVGWPGSGRGGGLLRQMISRDGDQWGRIVFIIHSFILYSSFIHWSFIHLSFIPSCNHSYILIYSLIRPLRGRVWLFMSLLCTCTALLFFYF